MNNVFVYCEIEGTKVAEVSQELLTKGRKLADTLGVQLEAVAAGSGITGQVEEQILPYGVDCLHIFDAPGLAPYTSKPHTAVLVNLFKQEQPQICLMGADVVGRDLGPRVSSALHSGLTADCTALEIGPHDDKKLGKHYDNLLYQIRPAFGGNIVATIVNPENRPQMATVRSGVMKAEILDPAYKGEVIIEDVAKYVPEAEYVTRVLDRHVEADGLLDLAQELGFGIITFSPLAQGMLSDKYLHGIPADSRAAKGGFLKPAQITEEKLARVRALNEMARQKHMTLAQMALCWVLQKPGITSVLVGASRPEQVAENAAVFACEPFTPEELAAIDAIVPLG